MGREIRMVPPNWEHPKDDSGNYKPLHDHDYESHIAEWIRNHELWLRGQHPDQRPESEIKYYQDWAGAPHYPAECRPRFGTDATWYQVYENVSEGTPVSPPFATKAELVEYLVENGDFWAQKRGEGGCSREAAERFVDGGYVPSMVITSGGKCLMGIDSAATLLE